MLVATYFFYICSFVYTKNSDSEIMGALNYSLFSQTATLGISLLEARNARGQFWCLVCCNLLHIPDAKQGCD